MDSIKITADISESEAFFNCMKILESFELENKQFAFTQNYIKWLLNKFQMPFVFIEPFEDVPPDEKPESVVAFAVDNENLISVPIKDLCYNNLYSHLGYITHELKHLSDYEFYMNNLLLGNHHEFFSLSFSQNLWKEAQVDEIDNSKLLRRVTYLCNPHEVGARENEWFYSNLFLRLINAKTINPFLKKITQKQIKKCLEDSEIINKCDFEVYEYKESYYYGYILNKIHLQIKKLYKQFLKIGSGDVKAYIDAKQRLFALISLYPDKEIAKKLTKCLTKNSNHPFNLAQQADSLEMLSRMPFNIATEKDINCFLLNRNKLTDYLIRSIEPTTLAQRCLLLNGSSSLFVNTDSFTDGYELEKNIRKIKSVEKEFKNYKIVGINNMPKSRAKKKAIKKFLNTQNFKLTPEVLEEYNEIFDGQFCYNILENNSNSEPFK